MRITLDFSNDFFNGFMTIVALAFSVLATYALGRYYLDKQKREAEKAQRIIDAQQAEKRSTNGDKMRRCRECKHWLVDNYSSDDGDDIEVFSCELCHSNPQAGYNAIACKEDFAEWR